jgi:hypothetical protein
LLIMRRQGTICPWRLAAHVAAADSVRRRFYRFFQHVELDSSMTAGVAAGLLGMRGKPWVLAVDRTNWDSGKTGHQHSDDFGDLERHGCSVDLDAVAA